MCKKMLACLFALLVLLGLTGCGANLKMPFNGDIEFHDIALTIPSNYVRDSTQSDDDTWVFERGRYASYFVIMRQDIDGDTSTVLDSYCDYLVEQGAQSERTTFQGREAVFTETINEDGNGIFKELYFEYNGLFYAVGFRGEHAEDFAVVKDSIVLLNQTAEAV